MYEGGRGERKGWKPLLECGFTVSKLIINVVAVKQQAAWVKVKKEDVSPQRAETHPTFLYLTTKGRLRI